MNMGKKLLFWLFFVLVLALAASSLNSARSDFPRAQGAGQKTVGYASLACGLSGLATAIGMLLRRRWCLHTMIVCGVSCVAAAVMATLWYGEAHLYAAITAGAATLAVVGLLYLGISKTLG